MRRSRPLTHSVSNPLLVPYGEVGEVGEVVSILKDAPEVDKQVSGASPGSSLTCPTVEKLHNLSLSVTLLIVRPKGQRTMDYAARRTLKRMSK